MKMSFETIWNEYVGAGFKPRPLTTENNAMHLAAGINKFIAYYNREPNARETDAIVRVLGDIDANPPGVLQFHHGAVAAQAAEDSTPPHASDKSLAWLNYIDDYVDAPKEKIARFCQPAARGEMTKDASGLTLGQRFDERVTWLQSRKVHRPKKEEQPEKALTPKERLAVESNEKWIALNNRINAFGGNRGYLKSVTTFRERLHRDLRSLIDEGKPFAECEAYIAREIKTREDGSIR